MSNQTTSQVQSHRSRSRFWTLAYVLFFLMICCVPMTGMLLGYQNPNLEKRTLSPLPSLTVDGQANLCVTREFDDYYADHFAFRSYLVSAYHRLNQIVLKQSGNSQVIAGKSGWLFFADTLPDYLAMPVLSDAQMRRLAVTMSIQQEHLAGMGIDFRFVIAPNKNSIYGQYMPDRLSPVLPENNLTRWLASPYREKTNTIDLLTPLRQAAVNASVPLYHMTDTHWNNLGARIGFQTIMANLKTAYPDFSYDDYQQTPYTTKSDWQGDLAVMLYPAGVNPDNQQYFAAPQQYRTLKPMRSLEDLLIQTSQTSAARSDNTLKIWLFRDSFANALIPFLANTCSSATFTREIPYNYVGIDTSKADVVILEIVERNLSQLLERAPVLTAPERPKPAALSEGSSSAQAGSVDASAPVKVEPLSAISTGTLLKITGQLTGQPLDLDSVGSIYLGLKNKAGTLHYMEATPIDETASASKHTVGLTAYLAEEAWQAGSQQVQVCFQLNDTWYNQDMMLNFPS